MLESDEDIPSTSKCGQCDQESDGESEMKTHLESHHELRCNICDFTCFDKSDLENHIEKKHTALGDKSEINNAATSKLLNFFECKSCNLTCKTEDKLENHMCRITVINPSFCDSLFIFLLRKMKQMVFGIQTSQSTWKMEDLIGKLSRCWCKTEPRI